MFGGSGVAVGNAAVVGEGVGLADDACFVPNREATACGVVPEKATAIATMVRSGKRKRFTLLNLLRLRPTS